MDYKKCGAIDCVWYDTDCVLCDYCEYDRRSDNAYYEGREAGEVMDAICGKM